MEYVLIHHYDEFEILCIRTERLLKEWALEEKQIVTEKKVVASKSGIKYFIKTISA